MKKIYIAWLVWLLILVAYWAFVLLPESGLNLLNQPKESLSLLAVPLLLFVIPFIIWEVLTWKVRKKILKQTGKRIKSYNIK